MKKVMQPNPQGKGRDRTLGYLREVQSELKHPALKNDSCYRILEDYLASLIVLSSKFTFRPVVGKTYYLYLANDRWVLSLVSPEEGGTAIFSSYLAQCRLNADTTWDVRTVNGSDLGISHLAMQEDQLGVKELDRKEDADSAKLRNIFCTENHTRYRSDLGYYQNVLNFTLGKVIAYRLNRILELEGGNSQEEKSFLLED